jgi:hypothetical protein
MRSFEMVAVLNQGAFPARELIIDEDWHTNIIEALTSEVQFVPGSGARR